MSSTGPDATYRAGLSEGKINIQKCNDCNKHIFFPRVHCPHCYGTSLEWREATGDGTVYSTTVVHRRPERGGDYNIALVDLAEGVRMMSTVGGIAPAEVSIGMPVTAYIGDVDGAPGVLFELREQEKEVDQ